MTDREQERAAVEESKQMTEEDNIHPVVRLLAARMESHPEEFYFEAGGDDLLSSEALDGRYRWASILERVKEWASGEDTVVLRKPFMDAIHRDALDELMNGPERRAEEERKYRECLKHYGQQKSMAAQNLGQYPNPLSSLSSLSSLSTGAYAAQMQNSYAQAGLNIQHDLASQQYRISNGTTTEMVNEGDIRGPGVLERVLNRLIK
jgi:hypothetical protein